MRHILPYPVLFIFLLAMWLLIQQSLAPGQIVLGVIVAFGASWAMAALEPVRPRVSLRKIPAIIRLFILVVLDIIASNITVIRLILTGWPKGHKVGFLQLPLELREPNGLAVLACIITATPGSAWINYDAAKSTVLIHVLDLVDEQAWITDTKNRYETLLMDIFQ